MFACLAGFVGWSLLSASFAEGPEQVIQTALTAMGGAEKVRRIRKVEVEFVGHNFGLEESERPEGPWFTTYFRGTTTADFDAAKLGRRAKANGLLMSEER